MCGNYINGLMKTDIHSKSESDNDCTDRNTHKQYDLNYKNKLKLHRKYNYTKIELSKKVKIC